MTQRVRLGEEIFTRHCEKLCRGSRAIKIYTGVMMVHQLLLQVGKCLAKCLRPFLPHHAEMQGRHAVGATVEHVQFVGKFMHHNISAGMGCSQVRGNIIPRENHRPPRPGLTKQYLVLVRD